MRGAPRVWLLSIALLLTSGTVPLWAGDTIYVKWDATGNNNGSSWEDAFTDLQDALAAADSSDQIWVAKGVYYPTNVPIER